MKALPNQIFSGYHQEGHVQGIAVDAMRGYVYYSFTTILLKTDMLGNAIGSVTGLAGHLGCITYDSEENKVYGSLELKHDAIGSGIINRIGWDPSAEDAFYLVCFDVQKINRMGMDAEKDGVMLATYLHDVVNDYSGTDPVSKQKHRYGCSGIDGTALGPVFGAPADSEKKITVAYGIYGDVTRDDNDYQVILQYDKKVLAEYAKPLSQAHPHHSGPARCDARYFFYTGNTTYGIQNLEYDSFSNQWFVAVYRGKKEKYSNFPMFVIDGNRPAVYKELIGRNGESGKVLFPAKVGIADKTEGIRGSLFSLGQTGMASLGDGSFYFSEPGSVKEDKTFCSTVIKYRYCPETDDLFIKI